QAIASSSSPSSSPTLSPILSPTLLLSLSFVPSSLNETGMINAYYKAYSEQFKNNLKVVR
ncbi:hypothetical protein WUBG_07164, partial [Wuchereria bancrofti]